MADNNGSKTSWFNLTNLLVTIALAFNALTWAFMYSLDANIKSVDNKMFVHLTNASIHIPRETVVSKDEFVIYQSMRDKQMTDLKEIICEIKQILLKQNDLRRN
jgi:hypothetical protein